MKPNRHTLQLCAQIAETLHLLFLDNQDDDLRELMVLEVLPISGAGTLLARLAYPVQQADDLPRVQQKLASSAKSLRSEIAREITRRRVPEILFQVIPSPSVHAVAANETKSTKPS